MDDGAFREAAQAAVEDIIKYNSSLPGRRVLPQIQPGYLKELIPSAPPDQPEPWQSIQDDVERKIVPGLTHWQSPNFMAFFPALVTYPSLLGEMYSAAFTAPAFNWLCSPACTELETIVMDWVAKALGLPNAFLSTSLGGGGGVIHGSASEAIVTAMVAARERYLRLKADAEGLQEDSLERDDRIAFLRGRMVAVSSDQAHSSTQKGALIAGTRYRSIATYFSEHLSLTASRLREALEKCYADGLEPYYVTLSLGATGTCAVDDFTSIATLRVRYPNLWIHIDAAYAGAALILPRYQDLYCVDIGRVADSFNVNLHKWLLVNFDASCFFVQNRNHLTRALSISPAYLQNSFTDSGLVTDYRDWQIPLGRRFRALKIWFVMRSYGLDGMRTHIENSIKVGEAFADMVRERSDLFELVAEPIFALTCLRVKPGLASAAAARKGSISTREGGVQMNGETKSHHDDPKTTIPKAATLSGPEEDEEAAEEPTMRVHSNPHDETWQTQTKSQPQPQTEPNQDPSTHANQQTRQIADLINSRAQIFITASSSDGKTYIRVVSGNTGASVEYARNAFRVIVDATEEVLGRTAGRIGPLESEDVGKERPGAGETK